MTQTRFSATVDVPAAPSQIWPVMTDVERWPEWTASTSRVRRLSAGPLAVGSRVRVHQPKLPPAVWRVTEFEPGASFTWLSVAPGVRVTACHAVEEISGGSRVTLSICYEGLFGSWLARWVGSLNGRYLEMEANGLKSRGAELTGCSKSPNP
jgi:uncharacterized protein YndB with AHSA1/START domain